MNPSQPGPMGVVQAVAGGSTAYIINNHRLGYTQRQIRDMLVVRYGISPASATAAITRAFRANAAAAVLEARGAAGTLERRHASLNRATSGQAPWQYTVLVRWQDDAGQVRQRTIAVVSAAQLEYAQAIAAAEGQVTAWAASLAARTNPAYDTSEGFHLIPAGQPNGTELMAVELL